MPHLYETDGAAIYRASFATIRAEADLARFTPEEEGVAVRMIHASGMVDLARHIRFAPGFAIAARAALEAGAPILCDARMVSEGITRARLPAGNAVICTLHDPEVPGLATRIGNTRSAAAVELWRPHLHGAVVAIGNAPTALFHLLNLLEDPPSPPGRRHRLPGGFHRRRRVQGRAGRRQPRAVVHRGRPARRLGDHRCRRQRAGEPGGMMGPQTKGKVVCIGLGPGDPELMSLRAHRLLTGARIVAYFRKAAGPGRRGGWSRG